MVYTFHYKSMKAFNDDKQMRSDWYIPICNGNERIKIDGKKAHSTQKPEALLHRVIVSTSHVGDVVLDPFMGSGTTGAVAKRLNRTFIGIEKDEEYVKIANERIARVRALNDNLLTYQIEEKKTKVPFGSLIEAGFIRAGGFLYSKDRKHRAMILANATIDWSEKVGSIHKISAMILDKASSNGWTYWYVEDKQRGWVLIDELRSEYMLKYQIG